MQRKPDLGDRCKIDEVAIAGRPPQVQRKPDLGDRCKLSRVRALELVERGCNGNLTWAIVASRVRITRPSVSLANKVQRKPDLGDRCKAKPLGLVVKRFRRVQRKPDLGDRCKPSPDRNPQPTLGRCNGNLTWAIVARPVQSPASAMPRPVQRKPDLGDRCKTRSDDEQYC